MAVLIVGLLFVPSDLGFEYSFIGGEQRMVLYIRVLFIPIRIPIRVKKDEEKLDQEAKKEEKTLLSGLSPEKFLSLARAVKSAYKKTRSELRDVYVYLKKHITFKQVLLHIRFGMDDAAQTGIMTGAVWTGGTCLLSVINNTFGIRHVDMNVTPVFTEQCFDIRSKSILTAQFVYIISIVVKVLLIVNTYVNEIEKGITKPTIDKKTRKGGAA